MTDAILGLSAYYHDSGKKHSYALELTADEVFSRDTLFADRMEAVYEYMGSTNMTGASEGPSPKVLVIRARPVPTAIAW